MVLCLNYIYDFLLAVVHYYKVLLIKVLYFKRQTLVNHGHAISTTASIIQSCDHVFHVTKVVFIKRF